MLNLPRLMTALITPFKEDLSVDYKGIQELALKLVKEGSQGLVVCGTTGESPTLSITEKLGLISAVKEAVGNSGTVIAGTGTNSTADSIDMTVEAEKAGADGIMLVVPYYNKPNQEGLYEHYKNCAEATSLPVIMYNVPGRTGVNMLPETVLRLSQLPNIIGIKEAGGNLDQVSTLKTLLPESFLIYCGDDSLTLPMLAVGAYGVISVASHIAAREINEMIEYYVGGEAELARKLHLKLFPLFKAMFITSNPIPVKKAVYLLGLPSGGLRLPLVEAAPEETLRIKNTLKEMSFI